VKILFIGESWLGSCARSLREALTRHPEVELDEFAEDALFPKPRTLWLRMVNRLTGPAYHREFDAQLLAKVDALRPDVLMAYKGNAVGADLIHKIRKTGIYTVNVYPDCSPHAHGIRHRKAVGTYDLVISTKAYHPAIWENVYGYHNKSAFVPQGYDPNLHLVPEPPVVFKHDVVMIATYRPEYGRLILDFARSLGNSRLNVVIGGSGWDAVQSELPANWTFPGAVSGRSYVSLLRSGRICIAPLTRNVVINGQRQPGDVDTTRTYELAAAHCFFMHCRTDYAAKLYEADEVPMYDDAAELAQHVLYYLAHEQERQRMATAAHRRAVPAYSLDTRAAQIMELLRNELELAPGQGASSP
jgi:spore maturation protein CgeB